jgi:hypothetical protein
MAITTTQRGTIPNFAKTRVYCAICRMRGKRTLVAIEPFDGQPQRYDGFCRHHMTGPRDNTVVRWDGFDANGNLIGGRITGAHTREEELDLMDATQRTFEAWDRHERTKERATG